MLSLQNAASGTNLVEATHVVLIDPVAGSKEEAIAVESQAIGRAHRMGQNKQVRDDRMGQNKQVRAHGLGQNKQVRDDRKGPEQTGA